ncbi:hypothetical protein CJ030_MR7G018910 [Morella rubra]|uniref:Uncharacterized protein n=1 Tax=Morella rubra TaxID=262757 RepID=A0A6A1V115_9ROSI|nr:hypothetical protein CJ030_MR7G018910 [Morella rubra]
MSKRARTSSQADIEQPFFFDVGAAYTIVMSSARLLSGDAPNLNGISAIAGDDYSDFWTELYGIWQLRPFWRIMHLILMLRHRPEEAHYGAFLHSLLVPECADEPRAVPGSINKTTLSKSIAQTRRALNAARAARVRRQEQPEEAGEQQDPGQSSTQGFGAQRPGWMDDMMTQLTERMQSVLRPTHEMVSDISCRLTTLEQKVMDMDSGWKKEIAAVQEAMRKAATSAELFALTQRVVHIEEHLSQIRDVLKITDDDDDDL